MIMSKFKLLMDVIYVRKKKALKIFFFMIDGFAVQVEPKKKKIIRNSGYVFIFSYDEILFKVHVDRVPKLLYGSFQFFTL